MRWPLLLLALSSSALAQEDTYSAECKNALSACETDLECSNRLAPLMAACSTGTCQPQCRMAVLNVYQNRLGRALLRSDASCLPGREELRTCHFLPTAEVVHCSLVKLSCEADLECNSAWEAFVSECEAESRKGACPARCLSLLSSTTATRHGAAFSKCTCTEREDQLCEHLRDNVIGSCTNPSPAPPMPVDGNSVTDLPMAAEPSHAETMSAASSSLLSLLSIILLLALSSLF